MTACIAAGTILFSAISLGADQPTVEFQPLATNAVRIVEAFELIGEPMPAEEKSALLEATRSTDSKAAIATILKTLDRLSLFLVQINPEGRVTVDVGVARPELMQQGWRSFLVRVNNESGITGELTVKSPNALPMQQRSSGSPEPKQTIQLGDVPHRFLDIAIFNERPMQKNLSGLEVEYRIVQIYCRDAGKRDATISFHVGKEAADVGRRSEVGVLFNALPAVAVKLRVLDENAKPTTAAFVFRDQQNRVYPAQSRRLAPDFFFHPQVYRHDGEAILLPPGQYTVETTRGPEYVASKRTITVEATGSAEETFQLKRWIDLKRRGWWSGDHHVHAAGCRHYDSPTEGVTPADMFRHVLGEDLNVGCVLSWGPCWYFQKQYFEGKVHPLSQPDYLMRYDIEVSGFPSSHSGHLCMLNLKEDDYPGTERIEQWPSWDLPILKWGKEQGAVVGFAHSGWGLLVESEELPNYMIPPFDGIGANEYIVDVMHDACDFISAGDTPFPAEMNIWYHTLNCGARCRISGESDFPSTLR